ncbi:prolyl hydroxylase family protein [Symmachiella dynata]|nr:2OG-Fe(II) oxygenase [Symmachiella dynata]
MSEIRGFNDAPITTSSGFEMRKDVRNNSRVMVDDVALAEDLWSRAEQHMVPTWSYRKPVGFNERFRFYRYEVGQTFKPHFDGSFARTNGQRSEFTFLVYLNDDFDGGETRFFEPELICVKPKTGLALVFHHPQLHEGAVVEKGKKYVLRTDVMYGGDNYPSLEEFRVSLFVQELGTSITISPQRLDKQGAKLRA